MEHYGCTQEQCSCPCHVNHEKCHSEEHTQGEFKANYFLGLADKAWEEGLKEKIKEYILQTQSDPVTKLAKLIAEGNHQRWRNRMAKMQGDKEFMEEICKYFSLAKK